MGVPLTIRAKQRGASRPEMPWLNASRRSTALRVGFIAGCAAIGLVITRSPKLAVAAVAILVAALMPAWLLVTGSLVTVRGFNGLLPPRRAHELAVGLRVLGSRGRREMDDRSPQSSACPSQPFGTSDRRAHGVVARDRNRARHSLYRAAAPGAVCADSADVLRNQARRTTDAERHRYLRARRSGAQHSSVPGASVRRACRRPARDGLLARRRARPCHQRHRASQASALDNGRTPCFYCRNENTRGLARDVGTARALCAPEVDGAPRAPCRRRRGGSRGFAVLAVDTRIRLEPGE